MLPPNASLIAGKASSVQTAGREDPAYQATVDCRAGRSLGELRQDTDGLGPVHPQEGACCRTGEGSIAEDGGRELRLEPIQDDGIKGPGLHGDVDLRDAGD